MLVQFVSSSKQLVQLLNTFYETTLYGMRFIFKKLNQSYRTWQKEVMMNKQKRPRSNTNEINIKWLISLSILLQYYTEKKGLCMALKGNKRWVTVIQTSDKNAESDKPPNGVLSTASL